MDMPSSYSNQANPQEIASHVTTGSLRTKSSKTLIKPLEPNPETMACVIIIETNVVSSPAGLHWPFSSILGNRYVVYSWT